MTAASKIKGNGAERMLCKILSDIFSGSFVRVPNSGANVGGKNVHRRINLSTTQDRAFRGDIIPPDHLKKMIIECKAYKEFRFHQLLQPGGCSILDSWIKQTIDILDIGDQWFVAMKINLKGWFVCIPDSECENYIFDNYCVYNSPYGKMRITELTSFFKINQKLIAEKAN